jgi:hypothetical protein
MFPKLPRLKHGNVGGGSTFRGGAYWKTLGSLEDRIEEDRITQFLPVPSLPFPGHEVTHMALHIVPL